MARKKKAPKSPMTAKGARASRARKPVMTVDWDKAYAGKDALEVFLGYRHAQLGEEVALVRALDTGDVAATASALVRSPLFQCLQPSAPIGLDAASDDPALLIEGSDPEKVRASAMLWRAPGFVQGVGETKRFVNLIRPEGVPFVANPGPMHVQPICFSASGEWTPVIATGTVKEVFFLLMRGELEVAVGERSFRLVACTDGEDPNANGCASIALKAKGEPGEYLSEVRFRSLKGVSSGLLVFFSEEQCAVREHCLLASNPRSAAGEVEADGLWLPIGPASVPWALSHIEVDQTGLAHENAQASGLYTIRDPYPTTIATQHFDIRVVVFPAPRSDMELWFSCHSPMTELLIPLHGSVFAQFGPRRIIKSEGNAVSLSERRRIESGFMPTTKVMAARNRRGAYQPTLMNFDAGQPHGFISANFDAAVCLHIVQSEIEREPRINEATKPKREEGVLNDAAIWERRKA